MQTVGARRKCAEDSSLRGTSATLQWNEPFTRQAAIILDPPALEASTPTAATVPPAPTATPASTCSPSPANQPEGLTFPTSPRGRLSKLPPSSLSPLLSPGSNGQRVFRTGRAPASLAGRCGFRLLAVHHHGHLAQALGLLFLGGQVEHAMKFLLVGRSRRLATHHNGLAVKGVLVVAFPTTNLWDRENYVEPGVESFPHRTRCE